MQKYNLNPNELFIIRILLLASEEDDEYLHRYWLLPEQIRGDFRNYLILLQEKGIINKSYRIPEKGQSFNPTEVSFNKNFVKGFYKASFDMGNELYDAYPMFGNIGGVTTSLRGVAKKFNSLEDCYRMYGKAINWNPEIHNEIIELINWAKNNTQFIQFTLATFVIDRKWEELKALKNGDLNTFNYDAIKMV